MDYLTSSIIFFAWSLFDWPNTQKRLKVWEITNKEGSILADLYTLKEDNSCQSIWDKIEVLVGTFWGTCQALGKPLL
jgi:hypothetical protein